MFRHVIKARAQPVVAALVLGGIWRLWLVGRYAGWEESDYGNLAMIQGVLDGGFRHYDMNHMPGYYALGAMVHAVVDDAVLAGRFVSFFGGLVALGIATSLAGWLDRLVFFHPRWARMVMHDVCLSESSLSTMER